MTKHTVRELAARAGVHTSTVTRWLASLPVMRASSRALEEAWRQLGLPEDRVPRTDSTHAERA